MKQLDKDKNFATVIFLVVLFGFIGWIVVDEIINYDKHSQKWHDTVGLF